jgi:hypothetical protein
MKPIAAIAAALAAGLTIAAANPAAADSKPNVASLLGALSARMDGVSAYQAHVSVNVQLHSFPFIAVALEGKTTYEKPGKYTVTFDSLPSLASSFQQVSGDIGDPAAWSDNYLVSIDPSTAQAGPGTIVLRLVQRHHGQIDHALAYVDVASSTVTRMDWYYYSGGTIEMDQHFAPVDGVLLADRQSAEIQMPGYKASVDARFDGYDIQVAMTRPVHTAH